MARGGNLLMNIGPMGDGRFDPKDVEMLEDLVLSAVRQAVEDAKKMAGDEMGKLTGGLKIPGLSM